LPKVTCGAGKRIAAEDVSQFTEEQIRDARVDLRQKRRVRLWSEDESWRGTGRSTRMVEAALRTAEAGRSRTAYVIASSSEHADDLFQMAKRAAERLGIEVECPCGGVLSVVRGDSQIMFCFATDPNEYRIIFAGRLDADVFVDHRAQERLVRGLVGA